MIRHVWTVLCSNVVIDRDSNNVSLQDVIEQVQVTIEGGWSPDAKSVLPIRLNLVTLWVRADYAVPAQGKARITVLSPAGDPLAKPGGYEINLADPYRRFRGRTRFGSLPVAGSGCYTFLVELQKEDEAWEPVAEIPLEVTIETSPPDADQTE